MKTYYQKFEVSILDFTETYNQSGTRCRYATCYIPELDTTESILLSDIEIR